LPTKTSDLVLFSRYAYLQRMDQAAGLGPGYNTTVQRVASTAYQNVRTGTALPKWRSIIKSGGSATTNMSGTKVRRLEATPIRASARRDVVIAGDPLWSRYYEEVQGILPDYNLVPSHIPGTSIESADSQAIILALSRVRQQRTHFQGLTFLGELGETIRQLKSPFKSARTLIDGYFKDLRKMQKGPGRQNRRGSSGSRDSFLTTAANTWLEVSFGLKPLISDVKDAAEAMARYQHDTRRTVVTGTGKSRAVKDEARNGADGNYLFIYVRARTSSEQSVRYKVTLDYSRSADFQSSERLRQLNGLTLEQFVPTVWELVPWSFLVDYFSNIGDVIAAGCTSQDEVKFVVRTERLETILVQTFTGGVGPFSNDPFVSAGTGQEGSSVTTRTQVTRQPWGLLAVPSFEFSLPGKTMQYANMLALWGSNERSLLSRFKRG